MRSRSNVRNAVVSPRNGVNILTTAKDGGRGWRVEGGGFAERYAERVSPPGTGGGWRWMVRKGYKGCSAGLPAIGGREMTKELRRGTVAWRMGAHTFHGCFRDKRYAGVARHAGERAAARRTKYPYPASGVLQLRVQRRRRRRRLSFRNSRARARANSACPQRIHEWRMLLAPPQFCRLAAIVARFT